MKIKIINTHPGENPLFVNALSNYLGELDLTARIVDGYCGVNPLDGNPERLFLTGVPLNVDYSLTQESTKRLVEKHFGWLLDSRCPVMGICYGFQIIAHIFGGRVERLEEPVREEVYPLELDPGLEKEIFTGIEVMEVFAEHRDYVSRAPGGFRVLAWKGEVQYIAFHPDREMYGVQFVPEFSGENGRLILRRFILGDVKTE